MSANHRGEAAHCTIWVDGVAVRAVTWSRLSAALWSAGWRSFSRHPVTGEPRGPLCGMGVCQECQVSVTVHDAQGRARMRPLRACMEPVTDGMVVSLGSAARSSDERVA